MLTHEAFACSSWYVSPSWKVAETLSSLGLYVKQNVTNLISVFRMVRGLEEKWVDVGKVIYGQTMDKQ